MFEELITKQIIVIGYAITHFISRPNFSHSFTISHLKRKKKTHKINGDKHRVNKKS